MSVTEPHREDTTSGFGRGVLLLALANGLYVVLGYGSTTILARMLDPDDFGGYGVVLSWITILTALLVKGIATSTAREMAGSDVDTATAWRAGAGLGMRLAIGLAVLGVAASPFASRWFGSGDLAVQFAIGSLGALSFGVNAVLLAWPTGVRDYARQSLTQAAYAVARLVLTVGGAAAWGIDGAIVGYVLAPLVASAPLLARHPAAAVPVAPVRRRMLAHVVPVALASVAVTGFFVVDVFAMSGVLGGASHPVGVYVAYGTLAHVPFFLLQATSIAMVPAIVAARGAAARAQAIRRTLTDTLVLLAGPTCILVAAGDAAARVVFGHAYRIDDLVVAPLALATAVITVVSGLLAVDVAIGRVRGALAIGGAGVAATACAAWIAARESVGHPERDVAWAVLAVSIVVLLALQWHATRRHGARVEVGRAARGVALGLGVAIPPLFVAADGARMLVAVVCGLAWVGLVLRLGLIDARRAASEPADV
ncbi:MAG: rane protein involved in the export of O-antigen and teichoic acid [Thermoleophilia bacterium]|nr:rane protein involved in the export of O-antigen and teichoic acid [Thermoleophilia bacterium]